MIKAKVLPIIIRVVSKLEAKPIIEKLKGLDLKSLDQSNQLSKEDKALLGFEMLSEFIPQLGKIEEDIIPLIAALEDVSLEDAQELDLLETLKKIFSNKELVDFFKFAWRKSQGV